MNDEIRECYRLLELEPGAPLEVVKEAYRELIKIWHPDRFPDDPKFQKRATEKTKALNGAFQKISAYYARTYTESNASARAAYEQARKAREASEAREREEAARRAREAAEAREREEAARRAREAAEVRAREEARLRAEQTRQAEEQARRQQQAVPPSAPPIIPSERDQKSPLKKFLAR